MTCDEDCATCDACVTYTVPWAIGTILYAPERFRQKVTFVERYKVVGYEVNERGTYVILLPQSYDGIATHWRIRDLYLTEQEAWEA